LDILIIFFSSGKLTLSGIASLEKMRTENIKFLDYYNSKEYHEEFGELTTDVVTGVKRIVKYHFTPNISYIY